MIHDINNAHHQAQQHACRLQRIGKNNRFNAALESVKNDHQQNDKSGQPERDLHILQNKYLQYIDNKIKPCGCAKHAGNNKEQGAGHGIEISHCVCSRRAGIGFNRRADWSGVGAGSSAS